MNVEIGAEAAQFPEKEKINGIVFAVHFEVSYAYDGDFLLGFMKSLDVVDVIKLPDSQTGMLRISNRKDYFL
jgi:hypothetical protein